MNYQDTESYKNTMEIIKLFDKESSYKDQINQKEIICECGEKFFKKISTFYVSSFTKNQIMLVCNNCNKIWDKNHLKKINQK